MDTLAGKLKKKGVDGFFIDNCDVYDYAHKKDIFDGLTVILKKIRAMGKPVVVNGGDIYVTAYQSRYGSAADIMTGVNQESVWSRIDFTTKTFHTQKKRSGSISASICRHAKRMEWMFICWNTLQTIN